jgi:hypothetical protein
MSSIGKVSSPFDDYSNIPHVNMGACMPDGGWYRAIRSLPIYNESSLRDIIAEVLNMQTAMVAQVCIHCLFF